MWGSYHLIHSFVFFFFWLTSGKLLAHITLVPTNTGKTVSTLSFAKSQSSSRIVFFLALVLNHFDILLDISLFHLSFIPVFGVVFGLSEKLI